MRHISKRRAVIELQYAGFRKVYFMFGARFKSRCLRLHLKDWAGHASGGASGALMLMGDANEHIVLAAIFPSFMYWQSRGDRI